MDQATDVTARLRTLDQEIRARQEEMITLRREQPPEPVEDFVLGGPGGERAPLSSLFGDKSDLIVVHNMGSSCPYCTLWADGFNGVARHLENRAAFVVVSPDTPDEQQTFAASRGWGFRMLSNGDSGFTEAMGYQGEKDGKRWVYPGFSTFRKRDDGSIVRIANAPFGPGDPYCGAWHLFDLLEGGVGDWRPKLSY